MTILEGKERLKVATLGLYDERESNNIAVLLIEWITGKNKTEQHLQKESTLTDQQILLLNDALIRLSSGEPIQYVIGEAWFMGFSFNVKKDVLIPRPETEELVDWVIKSILPFEDKKISVLDIGTGSGCIPISLKKKAPFLQIQAIDISANALTVAGLNADKLNTSIDLNEINFLDDSTWSNINPIDIIISNPPYIKESEKMIMHQNVFAFEPHNALFVPNNDPLIFYKAIYNFSKTHLLPFGSIFLEINEALGQEVVELFSEEGTSVELRKDMQGKDRMIKVQKLN